MTRIFTLFLLGLSLYVDAQSVSSSVVAAGGSFFSNSTASISATIGQVIVGDLTKSNLILHQGFQVVSSAGIIAAVSDEALLLNVYPNPAWQRLFITGGIELSSYSFEWFNIGGQLLDIRPQRIDQRVEFNIEDLPPALYLLRVRGPQGGVKTISIIKSN